MEKFDLFSILALIGGLALFLYGMEVMGDALKKLAGGKLESILARLTSNRFKGFLLGLGVTAVIQSSSATTVMLVGFVNSGIMKLGQTISIIMGANVGTTVTAWLLSTTAISGESAFILKLFKPTSFTPILAAIGIIMIMMGKSEKKKDIGKILIGFAVLMFGMDAMSGAMEGLKNNPEFSALMMKFSNPVLGILIGTILTAIIQSSSASVGILQALSVSVGINYSTAIPIILGQNIGTTITPILSSISGNKESKRVAFSCLYIKMIGVVIVATVFYILNGIFSFTIMEQNMNVSPFTIAVVHTLFNIISTVILMPFCSWIEKLAIKTIKGDKNQEEHDELNTLDERFLNIPSFAVEKCHELVCRMADIAKHSLIDACNATEQYNREVIEKVYKAEELIDKYEDKIGTYLVKLSSRDLSEKDSREVTELLHCIGDIERIGDHAVNICQVAEEVYDKKIEYSAEAKHDIGVISSAVKEVMTLATEALVTGNLDVSKKVEPLEQVIDRLKHKIKGNHIDRLKQGNCSVEAGFTLSDLLVNYERVSDHCSNIAVCMLEIANDSFETHEYLSDVKSNGKNDFFEMYGEYKEKYKL